MLSEHFRKWDLIPCALSLLLAAVLAGGLAWYGHGHAAQLVILQDGEQIYSHALAGLDTRIEVGGDYPLTVAVENGEVWVETSSCPGGDCQKQGRIRTPGQSIVCLPDRVTVAIEGRNPGNVDITVG